MRNLLFQVGGKTRACPRGWYRQLEGPKPDPTTFVCDGCSNSPDTWRGLLIWPACVIHDYHYRTGVLGGTWRDRALADLKFRRNVVSLLRLQGLTGWRANVLAWIYYGRVRIWGRSAYRFWEEGEHALPLWRRIGETYGIVKPRSEGPDEHRER